MRNLFVALFFIIPISGIAQSGSLKVRWYAQENVLVEFELISDSFYHWFEAQDTPVVISDLNAGVYKLNMYVEEKLNSTYHNIEVKEGRITEINPDIHYSFSYVKKNRCDNITLMHYNLGFSPKSNSLVNGGYKFGVTISGVFGITEKFGFCLTQNFGYEFYDLSKKFQINDDLEERFGHYRSMIYSPGFDLYYSFSPIHECDRITGFISAGIYYNFPVLFRYIYYAGNKKVVQHWIHSYKDFSIKTRLGYKSVGVFGEYKLTEYMKNGFPQTPRFTIGISYILPGNFYE